jgi:hypothetical protein
MDKNLEESGKPPSKEYHEIANAFPLMKGSQFDDLVADIRANGLRIPITTFEGKVLDGRNRQRACLLAGVTPVYVPLPANCPPVDFVISGNLNRRHLIESQRSMIAAKLATMVKGGGGVQSVANGSRDPLVSQADAAKKLDVSVESVKRAKVVKDKGAPETIAAVETGQLAVKPAAKIAREPKEKQPALVKAAGERSSRKSPKTEVQRKADKYLREQKADELQLFARTLVEKFEGAIPQLLTWLDDFSNVATAKAIRQIWN